MSITTKENPLHIARLYETAQRMYTAIPYKFFKSGYAFPPWHFYFEVTRRCNLRCKMCQYIEWLENVPIKKQMEGELATEEWLNVIGQVQKWSLVTFTGGEPFVRRDFMELLTYASSRARTHFISNTTMLPEDRCEAIVGLAPKRLGGLGFNFAGTSLEGPGERHDEIRQMKGAFERSMNGVRTLERFREKSGKQCPLVHITTVIQQRNIDVLHHMPKVAKEAGADVLNLVTETRMHELPGLGEVDPQTFSETDIQWPRIERKALAEALDKTFAAARDAGIELRLPRMPKDDILNYYESGIDLKNYECRNAWNTLVVGRQGSVYPCWIVRIGNVRENTIKEMWNNAKMRDFRQLCQRKLFAMCPGCCFLEHKTHRDAGKGAANASVTG